MERDKALDTKEGWRVDSSTPGYYKWVRSDDSGQFQPACWLWFYIQTFRCPLESPCLSFIVIKKSQRNISVLLAYCSRAETCHYRNDNRHKGTESSGHLSTETHQSNTGHPSSDPLLGSYTKIHVSQRLLQKQKYTRLIYIALFKTFSIQQVCGFHKI